jgi:hypothetical protein
MVCDDFGHSLFQDGLNTPLRLLCLKVMKEINAKLHLSDLFGVDLLAVKEEYLDVQKAISTGNADSQERS